MANVTLTSAFNDLDVWPGRLFDTEKGGTVTLRTATQFSFTHGPASEVAGYKVLVTGTGFTYVGGVPTGGTVTQVRVVNDSGQTLITFAGVASGGSIAGDFSQLYSDMFGSSNGPGPEPKQVWNMLLSGKDTITGTAGNDRQTFIGVDAGNDTYNLGGGDDQVAGGMGNDIYNGGDGFDKLTFRETTWNEGAGATQGAKFNIAAGTVLDPWGGTDKFTNMEAFEGSRFNDTFVGRQNDRDEFSGLRGRDYIDGGANSFLSNGQESDDQDRVNYDSDYWRGGTLGIVVDLEKTFAGGSIKGTIRDGFGNTDTVVDIERVAGTRFADSFTGSRIDNRFFGGEGKDQYAGEDGFDTVDLGRWFADTEIGAVNVDLSRATGQIINDGFGNTETATSIEEIAATDRSDTLKGSSAKNRFEGRDGSDTMTGGGGSDEFFWWHQEHIGDEDRITDFTVTGASADKLVFEVRNFDGMSQTVRLVNGTSANTDDGTFLFINATDRLIWDSNGSDAGGQSLVAILSNVSALSTSNFELWF